MRRVVRALRLFFGTRLTWTTSWRLARTGRRYQVVERDGFLYVEPR